MDGAATFSLRLGVVCVRLVVSERPGLVGQKQICRQLTCQDGRDDLTVESCRRFRSLVVPCKSRTVAFSQCRPRRKHKRLSATMLAAQMS